MRGVQESLAGRVAVLSLTSLSQAEISGGAMEPFTVDLEKRSERKKTERLRIPEISLSVSTEALCLLL